MGRDALEKILWEIYCLGEDSGERYANGLKAIDGQKEINAAIDKILDKARQT